MGQHARNRAVGATVASAVIRKMNAVRFARKFGKLTRVQFLKAWGKLRAELAKTKEYRTLRNEVGARADGNCEGCGNRVKRGGVVHHVVPVAWNPDLALTPSNCKFLCYRCHVKVHPWLAPKEKRGKSLSA